MCFKYVTHWQYFNKITQYIPNSHVYIVLKYSIHVDYRLILGLQTTPPSMSLNLQPSPANALLHIEMQILVKSNPPAQAAYAVSSTGITVVWVFGQQYLANIRLRTVIADIRPPPPYSYVLLFSVSMV